jgi:pterin-4a-carbinolamine dehydratase
MKITDILEGKFRSQDIEEFVPQDSDLDNIKSEYLPDWEMLDHRTLQAKYVAKDHRHALEFVGFVNELSEKMDHFAEVTQDVAEVTVKTSTFDVKGLTILDFKLALYVDSYAEKNDIEQVRMQGNFGMHEGKKDACYNKVKSRVKVWPSAYASGQLVQCRKRGAANWGKNKKK